MRGSCLFAFVAANVLAQQPDPVDRAINNYNKVTQNCAENSCKEDAQEAAADILQRLIAQRPSAGNRLLPLPVSEDLGEGRRIAMRLMPEWQAGASPATGGGTALTSLASVAELIAAAMESGAFQRSTAGAVSTIRVNPVGAARLLAGQCPAGSFAEFPLCIAEDRSRWRGLSFMTSFDSSRGDQTAPGNAAKPAASASAVFLRAKRGLASAGIRYDFYKPANQNTKEFLNAWKTGAKELTKAAVAYSEVYADALLPITKSALIRGLPAKLHERLQKIDPSERRAVAEKFFREHLEEELVTLPSGKLGTFQKVRREFLQSQLAFYRDTLERRLFSLEFQHQRPKDELEYGSITFIWGDTAGKHTEEDKQSGVPAVVPNWSFTVNAGANFFYDKVQVQKDRALRDFHVSFQADRRLWNWKVLNKPTFTLAGYYQRLTDDAVLSFNSDAIVPDTGIALPKPANVILKDTKGNVGIVQAKLTIPLHDAGVSFPMAVTWSNRTELMRLPGNDVRGHFGMQFDIDKLLGSFKAPAKAEVKAAAKKELEAEAKAKVK